MKKLVDEIRTLQKRIKELEVKIPKLAMEVEGCNTTRSELTKLIPHLRQECELSDADKDKLKTLLHKVDSCRSDVDGCAKMASKLEKEVARLQKAILDAGGPALKSQKSTCEKLLEEVETLEKSLKSAQVAIGASSKAAEKARKARESAEAQMEECLKIAEEKQQEYELLEKDAFEVMQAYEKVKVIEEEKRTKLEHASQECEELKKALSSAKCAEVDLAGQMEALKKQIRECISKKQHWEQEIAKLQKAADEDDYFLPEDQDDKDDEHDAGTSDEEMADCKEDDHGTSSQTSLPQYAPDILDRHGKEKIKERIQVLEAERTDIAKNANMGAIEEYRKKEADYLSK
jgi:structural maintenance of chromosome 4